MQQPHPESCENIFCNERLVKISKQLEESEEWYDAYG
jgi:hypothetical protein